MSFRIVVFCLVYHTHQGPPVKRIDFVSRQEPSGSSSSIVEGMERRKGEICVGRSQSYVKEIGIFLNESRKVNDLFPVISFL